MADGTTARGGGPRALAAAVARLTRPALGRRGFADGAIVANWDSVVGSDLARQCLPERIQYPRGERAGGTLRLRVASGGLAVEIQHLAPILIERINSYFGYGAVARIRITHGPVAVRESPPPPPPPPLDAAAEAALEAALAGIEDSDLRASLRSLGRSLKARRRS